MIMIIPAGDEWGQRKSSFRGEDSERKSRVLWLVGTSEMHYLDISLFVVAFGHPSINSFRSFRKQLWLKYQSVSAEEELCVNREAVLDHHPTS